jgi:hypothetical protein
MFKKEPGAVRGRTTPGYKEENAVVLSAAVHGLEQRGELNQCVLKGRFAREA